MGHDYDTETYHIWLLRFWQERKPSPDTPAVWRFSLENGHTRQRQGFGKLEEVMDFLREQMAQHGQRSTLAEDSTTENDDRAQPFDAKTH